MDRDLDTELFWLSYTITCTAEPYTKGTVPNCTKYKDSYESAHLLSAGLYHYIHPSPLAPAAGTPDSSTRSSTDSSKVYTQYTKAQCTPVAQQ